MSQLFHDDVNRIITHWKSRPGPLLPVLQEVQELQGYIPPDMVPVIADGLNLSRAEVHGVISFYHHFRTEPVGRHIIQVCRAEACQSMGCRGLEKHAKQKLGIDFHGISADNRFTLEPVYCLGNCALAPAVMVDETVYGRVTPGRFDEIVEEYTNGGRA